MLEENQLTFKLVRMMNEDGEILSNNKTATDTELLEMYQWMKKARLLDEKLLRMQRQGRIGTYAPLSGQEAAQVGSAFLLQSQDWICPSYRDAAACIVHGLPIEQFILYAKGHLYGGRIPEGLNILPVQIIIAAQTLHAVGIAHAAKYKGEKSVSVSYFGDGATSQGDFHEALNFAAVYQLPTIFFCQNNQYAISVPLEKQMASKTIAQKAVAYGMKGVQVDGNDVLAVYEVMKEAIERARNGEGPTLIEAVTYRFGPHTTSDDPSKYRQNEEVNKWVDKDPLLRLRKWLTNQGLWNDEKERICEASFQEELNRIIEQVEMEEFPKLAESFNFVFNEKTPLLTDQQNYVKKLYRYDGGENE
nr:pyruvate dehydrogenase (acetyl-transferring) E1 component subunit alpha [Bacillus andreraoultii]